MAFFYLGHLVCGRFGLNPQKRVINVPFNRRRKMLHLQRKVMTIIRDVSPRP